MSIGLVVLGIVLFVMLIIVHELGHFLIARRNNVDAEEFGIFFPPRLWSHKTKAGWEFSFNLLPLGGFVRLKGEHDEDRGKGTYGAASLSTKVKILIAGVTMNLVIAFLMLTMLGWLGLPQLVNNQFSIKSDTHIIENEVLMGPIQSGTPAAKAGLNFADKFIAVLPPDGKTIDVNSKTDIPALTKSLAGQTVGIEYVLNNKTYTKTVHLFSIEAAKNYVKQYNKTHKSSLIQGVPTLGISPYYYELQRSTWSAPIAAGGLMGQFIALTFHGLATAITGLVHGNTKAATSQVAGPVGIYEILQNGSILGYQFILMIVAVISLSLAIMNILPIPALDGGKLFVTVLARLLRKKLTAKIENALYGAGFAILITLLILITIVDVRRY
jgi:regulator of sigma E protease